MSEEKLFEGVGYGKPPKSSQFQKGISGNPTGRPKGSKNLASIFLRESRRLVRINGPRGSRNVTKVEATAMQMGNKAAQGDMRASREFLHHVNRSEESVNASRPPMNAAEADRQMMQSIVKRMSGIKSDEIAISKENK